MIEIKTSGKVELDQSTTIIKENLKKVKNFKILKILIFQTFLAGNQLYEL